MAQLAHATPSGSAADVSALVADLRHTFDSGKTRPVAWRVEQLSALVELLEREERRLFEALRADLGKPAFEAYAGEIGFLKAELKYALRHLHRWVRPRWVPTPMVHQPGVARIYPEPLGVVLVIAPWNYPVQLALAPMAGALSAGNCVVVKPSEIASATSSLLAEIVPRYIDHEAVAVVEGGVPETTRLLEERFDHIFYTGNGRVGRIIMTAAAKHLTPVTLELGGKSPTLVDGTTPMELTARRICWGKFFNAGQTCVAPDYVLVQRDAEDALLEALKKTLRAFYGDNPRLSPDYARIVNDRHMERLAALLDEGEIVVGGETSRDERYIAPTVVRNVPPDGKLMSDEIFGPILPVLTYDTLDDAISFVRARPKPLALYIFTARDEVKQRVLEQCSAGGVCVNETVSHLGVPGLPFGGVGDSGMGAYHGRYSFETFSHMKPVFDKALWGDVPLRYPPYGKRLKLVKRLM